MSITTTFIIPHKGREEMLLQTLESIASLNTPKEEYEVIIVSQNVAVSERISSLDGFINLKVVYNSEERTISQSRNLGASLAKGQYLAFLDADIELMPDWLDVMQKKYTTSDSIVLLFGTQISFSFSRNIEKIRTCLASATSGGWTKSAPGANLFLSKNMFDTVNGFPEQLRTCEDIYFSNKVSEHGKIFHEPKAQFIHIGEDNSYISMFKKEIWRGQSNLASLRGRKIPLREIPSFLVPFVATIGIIFGFVGLLSSNYFSCTLGLFLALSPMVAYTFRLKKLVKEQVPVQHCFLFYLLYFPARALGTLLGVRGAVTTSSHK